MTVELGFPSDAYLMNPINPGDEWESNRQIAADGVELYQTFWLGLKLTYQIQLCIDTDGDPETSDERSQLKAWRQHLRNKTYGNYGRFWAKEVDQDHSTHMLAGFGDGSATTFPIPLFGGSEFAVFVEDPGTDGGPAYQNSGITTYATWNLNTLSSYGTDQVCSFSDGSDDGYITINSATLTADRAQSVEGMYSGRIDGALANAGIRTESSIAVSEGVEYTAAAHCKGDGTVYLRIIWYDGGATNGFADSAAAVLDDDVWSELSVTATAPALTDGLRLQVYRTTTTSTPYWVDMIGLSPGSSSRVWVPSACPGVVVFDAAPTSGHIISASGYGRRMVLVAEDGNRASWPLDEAGQPQMALRVTEQFPVPA